MHRLLRRDGRCYITVPTEKFDTYSIIYQLLMFLRLRDLAERYRKIPNKFWRHFNYYTREGWTEILRRCGFNVVSFQEYDSKGIALINDFLFPFSALSLIFKKIINRWVLFPRLRRFYIYPFYLMARCFVDKYAGNSGGGFIFFSLRKG